MQSPERTTSKKPSKNQEENPRMTETKEQIDKIFESREEEKKPTLDDVRSKAGEYKQEGVVLTEETLTENELAQKKVGDDPQAQGALKEKKQEILQTNQTLNEQIVSGQLQVGDENIITYKEVGNFNHTQEHGSKEQQGQFVESVGRTLGVGKEIAGKVIESKKTTVEKNIKAEVQRIVDDHKESYTAAGAKSNYGEQEYIVKQVDNWIKKIGAKKIDGTEYTSEEIKKLLGGEHTPESLHYDLEKLIDDHQTSYDAAGAKSNYSEQDYILNQTEQWVQKAHIQKADGSEYSKDELKQILERNRDKRQPHAAEMQSKKKDKTVPEKQKVNAEQISDNTVQGDLPGASEAFQDAATVPIVSEKQKEPEPMPESEAGGAGVPSGVELGIKEEPLAEPVQKNEQQESDIRKQETIEKLNIPQERLKEIVENIDPETFAKALDALVKNDSPIQLEYLLEDALAKSHILKVERKAIIENVVEKFQRDFSSRVQEAAILENKTQDAKNKTAWAVAGSAAIGTSLALGGTTLCGIAGPLIGAALVGGYFSVRMIHMGAKMLYEYRHDEKKKASDREKKFEKTRKQKQKKIYAGSGNAFANLKTFLTTELHGRMPNNERFESLLDIHFEGTSPEQKQGMLKLLQATEAVSGKTNEETETLLKKNSVVRGAELIRSLYKIASLQALSEKAAKSQEIHPYLKAGIVAGAMVGGYIFRSRVGQMMPGFGAMMRIGIATDMGITINELAQTHDDVKFLGKMEGHLNDFEQEWNTLEGKPLTPVTMKSIQKNQEKVRALLSLQDKLHLPPSMEERLKNFDRQATEKCIEFWGQKPEQLDKMMESLQESNLGLQKERQKLVKELSYSTVGKKIKSAAIIGLSIAAGGLMAFEAHAATTHGTDHDQHNTEKVIKDTHIKGVDAIQNKSTQTISPLEHKTVVPASNNENITPVQPVEPEKIFDEKPVENFSPAQNEIKSQDTPANESGNTIPEKQPDHETNGVQEGGMNNPVDWKQEQWQSAIERMKGGNNRVWQSEDGKTIFCISKISGLDSSLAVDEARASLAEKLSVASGESKVIFGAHASDPFVDPKTSETFIVVSKEILPNEHFNVGTESVGTAPNEGQEGAQTQARVDDDIQKYLNKAKIPVQEEGVNIPTNAEPIPLQPNIETEHVDQPNTETNSGSTSAEGIVKSVTEGNPNAMDTLSVSQNGSIEFFSDNQTLKSEPLHFDPEKVKFSIGADGNTHVDIGDAHLIGTPKIVDGKLAIAFGDGQQKGVQEFIIAQQADIAENSSSIIGGDGVKDPDTFYRPLSAEGFKYKDLIGADKEAIQKFVYARREGGVMTTGNDAIEQKDFESDLQAIYYNDGYSTEQKLDILQKIREAVQERMKGIKNGYADATFRTYKLLENSIQGDIDRIQRTH